MSEVVNLKDKFAGFDTHWEPKIVGELNGQHVKLTKFQGEFIWHSHESEDEVHVLLFEPAVTLNTGGEGRGLCVGKCHDLSV